MVTQVVPRMSPDCAAQIRRSLAPVALAVRRGAEAPPLTRYHGPKAPFAHLRARVDRARLAGDSAEEYTCAQELAIRLGSRDASLDEAIRTAGAPFDPCGSILIRHAQAYRAVGNVAAEVSSYARCVAAGVELPWLGQRLAELEGLLPDIDTEIMWLELRAESFLQEGQTISAWATLRSLGALYWDAADDRARAVAAWMRAAQLDSSFGYATFRRDLVAFSDARVAADCLAELAGRESTMRRAAVLTTEAGKVALEVQSYDLALRHAQRALAYDPGLTEALGVAELACAALGCATEMSAVYEQVADGTLGRFGRRAAHRRAAQFFDAGGVASLAVRHAAEAFASVPSEGGALRLLASVAAKAHCLSFAAHTVERVAGLERLPEKRAGWLLRASQMCDDTSDGLRQRIDLLLEATVLSASLATLSLLVESATTLIAISTEDREGLALRLELASQSMLREVNGPEGARMALALAHLAVDVFRNTAWAWRCLERASESDGELDEYRGLLVYADVLARDAEARGRLRSVLERCERPYASCGQALLELLIEISEHAGDGHATRGFLALAAVQEPAGDVLGGVATAPARTPTPTEEALLAEIADPAIARSARARCWSDLVNLREQREELSGATDAALQAAIEEGSAARWERVERLAEASGREHIRVEALRRLVECIELPGKNSALRRLARAEGARGSLTAAESAWNDLLLLAPNDEEAAVAIEALLTARSSFDELAEHLARRATALEGRSEDSETLRAVRLRRAGILEQRLNRFREAAEEIEAVLRDAPGHEDARRWLASLRERIGDPERIAREGACRVRIEAARAAGDAGELAIALRSLADVSREPPHLRAEWLVEAAQSFAQAGDSESSLVCSREAAALAPDLAATQLFLCGVEYRLRGVGTPAQARDTIASLRRFSEDGSLDAEDAALCAFLLAEASDLVASGTGEQYLRSVLVVMGPLPLVALGLAERRAANGQWSEAARFYAQAAQGQLLGLRRAGRVAADGAEASLRAGNPEGALVFLPSALHDSTMRERALDVLRRALPSISDAARAAAWARDVAGTLEPNAHASVLAETARVLFDSTNPSDRIEADRMFREAMEVCDDDHKEDLRAQLETLHVRAQTSDPEGPSVLRNDASRTVDILALRRRVVDLHPGDLAKLSMLREAAQADRNANYVRALDHVLHGFGPLCEEHRPPLLGTQSVQPGLLALLNRHSREPAGQVFATVYEGAARVFARSRSADEADEAAGLERVVPGYASGLSRLLDASLRLLDSPPFCLFFRRGEGALAFRIALDPSLAAILEGDPADERRELPWLLGQALASTLPHNALLLGLPEVDAESLWQVILGAFGPPGETVIPKERAALAELLWHTLPPKDQRRLRDLLSAGDLPSFDLVSERARQSGRRVGLYLCGDFAYAARRLVAEQHPSQLADLERPGGLRRLCAELPGLADLYRLAVRPEYADARWRLPTQASRRSDSSSQAAHLPASRS